MKAEVRHTNANDLEAFAARFGSRKLNPSLALEVIDAADSLLLSKTLLSGESNPIPRRIDSGQLSHGDSLTATIKLSGRVKYGILDAFRDLSRWSRPQPQFIGHDGKVFYCPVFDKSARTGPGTEENTVAYLISDVGNKKVTIYTDNVEFLNDCLGIINADKLHGQIDAIKQLQAENGKPLSQTI